MPPAKVPAFGRQAGVPRLRWVPLVTALLVFGCLLLVNGLVRSEFPADHQVAPPASASLVPDRIRGGGPIIDPASRPARSYPVPRKTAVLTFDDGPDPAWTPEVLATLREHRVPATFFVVGSLAARHPHLIREMRASGSEIGVHTFSHPDLAYSADWRRRLELSETQPAIAGAAGVTSSLVRPPYSSKPSAIDDNSWPVIQDLGRRGYVTVLTTHDSEDWKRPGVDEIVRAATPKNGDGAIILMHDAGGDRSQTVAALHRLIPRLKGAGYTFRTVADVLREPTANPKADGVQHARGLVRSSRCAWPPARSRSWWCCWVWSACWSWRGCC